MENVQKEEYRIFEVGLGTALNAMLTFQRSEDKKIRIYYEAIETNPLDDDLFKQLNYGEQIKIFHTLEWTRPSKISDYFTFCKRNVSLPGYSFDDLFDLIYFDAFAPAAQPELWTKIIFEKMYAGLNSEGVLVTYCSKSDVRRAMLASGFHVEKIPGPPRKREMLRAIKK